MAEHNMLARAWLAAWKGMSTPALLQTASGIDAQYDTVSPLFALGMASLRGKARQLLLLTDCVSG